MPWSIRGQEPASTRLVDGGAGSGDRTPSVGLGGTMGKQTEAGIDVSKDVLDVAVRRADVREETARFANEATGHRKLVSWLTKRGHTARVVLEATGTYSFDVALGQSARDQAVRRGFDAALEDGPDGSGRAPRVRG